MAFQNRQLLFALVLCTILATCASKPKHIDCSKYIYAPPCRGATAKRDLRRYETLVEDPRSFQEESEETIYPRAKLGEKNLLDTLMNKIAWKSQDYDTGTNNYIH